MPSDYFNVNAVKPDMSALPAAMQGAAAMQDRQAYQRALGLQQLVQSMSAGQQAAEMPSKIGANVATNQATAATIGPQKQAELEQTQLGNQFNRETMGSRVAKTGAESADTVRKEKLNRLKDGVMYSTAIVDALGTHGPAGASAVVQHMKQAGIDVQNDPVVNYVLSATDADEARTRAKYVQYMYHRLDNHYATEEMKSDRELTKAILSANVKSDVANKEHSAATKEHDIRWQAAGDIARSEFPNDPVAQRKRQLQIYDSGKFGAAKPVDTAEGRKLEDSISDIEKVIGYFKPTDPMRKQLEQHLESLKAQRRTPVPLYGVGGGGGGAQPRGTGTADDPIILK